ncbi:MAG: TRAP transporter substrate-binding protein [Pseudomonadales bacterium]|nr:TRAP transporter substrate-binding protein [Pseudomonadales bacterium]
MNISQMSSVSKTLVKAFFKLLGFGGFVAFWSAGLEAQESEKIFYLKLHHMQSAASPAHRLMLSEWADKVSRESNGRIQIRIFPSMQLGGQSAGVIDQIRDGITDIGWTLPGYTPGRFPNIEVFELPFMVRSTRVMNHAMYDFVQGHPEEFSDVKILQIFAHAGQVIHSKTPIRNAGDFAGKKIRVPSRVSSWIVDAMGGIPLGTPVPKIPEMLSKGIIDATFIPYEASYGLKIHELVDYHISFDMAHSDRLQTQIFIFAMNWDSYRALPEDLRAVIDNNSGENTLDWFAQKWVDFEVPGEKAAAESGELIKIPAGDVDILRERIEQPVIEKWISTVAKKNIDGRQLLQEARELLQKYENQY